MTKRFVERMRGAAYCFLSCVRNVTHAYTQDDAKDAKEEKPKKKSMLELAASANALEFKPVEFVPGGGAGGGSFAPGGGFDPSGGMQGGGGMQQGMGMGNMMGNDMQGMNQQMLHMQQQMQMMQMMQMGMGGPGMGRGGRGGGMPHPGMVSCLCCELWSGCHIKTLFS